jgi:hypothetical protein
MALHLDDGQTGRCGVVEVVSSPRVPVLYLVPCLIQQANITMQAMGMCCHVVYSLEATAMPTAWFQGVRGTNCGDRRSALQHAPGKQHTTIGKVFAERLGMDVW